MKKVLLASTVLAMTATVAAAEVSVSGNARMGVVYNGNAAENKLQFANRIRVIFTMSGETDTGLAFGATVRADQAQGANRGGNGGSVFVSGAFGTITMGDVVGAAEEVVGDLPEIGFQDLNDGVAADNDTIFLTGDGAFYSSDRNPGVLYTYSTGALTVALGLNDGQANGVDTIEDDGLGNVIVVPGDVDGTQAYSVGVKYAVDAYSVSLGYEVADPDTGTNAEHLIIGGSTSFGGVSLSAFYGDGSGAIAGFKHYGIGASYTMDALTVKGYVKETQVDVGSPAAGVFGAGDVTAYGIGAAYALGGGATLEGGIVDNDAPGRKTRADFGIKFAF